jgi:predicted RNA-binding Zn ribbon-like protein
LNHQEFATARAVFLAGDPALDFLNTRMLVNREVVDFLQDDNDVFSWLRDAGLIVPVCDVKLQQSSLLHSARKLRECIRVLVEMRKTGRQGDPQVLNSYLASCDTYPQLIWSKPHSLTIDTLWRAKTPDSILAPIAKAAADLLALADFAQIKRCEDEVCALWFIDQTKSKNRRWCSSQLCGNRHKVAAYRKRRRAENLSHG